MKFKSRKDPLFSSIIYALCVFLVVLLAFNTFSGTFSWKEISTYLILLGALGLMVWVFQTTRYELTSGALYYKSGPIKGSLEINTITEIIKGKTLWVGMRPATARKGLIIKYHLYDELYISPEDNDAFIEEIQGLNGKIKITTVL